MEGDRHSPAIRSTDGGEGLNQLGKQGMSLAARRTPHDPAVVL